MSSFCKRQNQNQMRDACFEMGDASAFFGEKMGNNGKRHYKAERVIMEKSHYWLNG